MVEISKHLFEQACQDIDCSRMLHFYNPSCWKSIPTTVKISVLGSAKFYSIVYVAQIVMRGRKMRKREEWMKMGEYYIRSTALGASVAITNIVFGCLFRWMSGNKINYYTYIFLPSMLNGLFIFMEPPSRRGLVVNLFSNLLIEYYLRSLERDGYLSVTRSKSTQTVMFMVGSALLFYLMRLEGDKETKTPLFWLYTPEKVKRKTDNSKSVCPHEGPCGKYILKGYSTYFSVGLGISLARQILPKIRTPVKAISSIRGKHFKMALFFGGYIGIYRAVICFLCRKRGFDSALYALPAGYFAGLSFLFSPSLGISIASLTAAFKLYSTILYERKVLTDKVPLPELLYCFCQGTLFHARYMHSDVCPSYMFNLMKTVSSGVSDVLFDTVLKEVKKIM